MPAINRLDKFIKQIKFLSTEIIYSILISKVQNKPSSYIYFENLYNDHNINWAATIYCPA